MKTNKIFSILVLFIMLVTSAVAQTKKVKAVAVDSVPEGFVLVDKGYLNFRDKSHPGLHKGAIRDGYYVEQAQYNYTGFYISAKGGYGLDNGILGGITAGYEFNWGRTELEGSFEELKFDDFKLKSPATSVNVILDLNKSKIFNLYIGARAGYIWFKSQKNVEGYSEPFWVKSNSFKFGGLAGFDVRVSDGITVGARATYDNFQVVKFGETIRKDKINAELVLTFRLGRR